MLPLIDKKPFLPSTMSASMDRWKFPWYSKSSRSSTFSKWPSVSCKSAFKILIFRISGNWAPKSKSRICNVEKVSTCLLADSLHKQTKKKPTTPIAHLPIVFQRVCQLLFLWSVHPTRVTISGETICELFQHFAVRRTKIEISNWMQWSGFDFPIRANVCYLARPIMWTWVMGNVINSYRSKHLTTNIFVTLVYKDALIYTLWFQHKQNINHVPWELNIRPDEIFTSVKGARFSGANSHYSRSFIVSFLFQYAFHFMIAHVKRVRLIAILTRNKRDMCVEYTQYIVENAIYMQTITPSQRKCSRFYRFQHFLNDSYLFHLNAMSNEKNPAKMIKDWARLRVKCTPQNNYE